MMSTRSIIWHAVNSWLLWRARRKLRNAVPALVALDAAERDARRLHRSGAREIASERKRLVTERLRLEMGRA
jgi:hypothetical protein